MKSITLNLYVPKHTNVILGVFTRLGVWLGIMFPPAPKFCKVRKNPTEIYTDTRMYRNTQIKKRTLENAHSQTIM